eukprot:Rhum_TRINITY_DN18607_c0_g1::Rhum_TRINITY_DN18607_c0_g1_i1::g.167837::m.167837
MDGLFRKLFDRRVDVGHWRTNRQGKYIMGASIMGMYTLAAGYTNYSQHVASPDERMKAAISWSGEYAQDFTVPGQPPLNLNLPPHLRLDMKSYLDLPETVIQPPPMYDDLHPYLRYRLKDLLLAPPYAEFSYSDTVDTHGDGKQRRSYDAVTPWGAAPFSAGALASTTNRLLDPAYDRRIEESVLHSQGKRFSEL